MTHRPHFNELHHTYLNETPVIHVYAEPYYTGQDSGSESEFEKSLAWFDKIKKTKQLIRKGFIEYIHPEVAKKDFEDQLQLFEKRSK